MGFFRLKRTRSLQNRSRLYPRYGLIGLVVLLSIALGVTAFLKARDNRQLALVHEQMKSSIQSDLVMILRTYDQLSLPRADIKGTLLPSMRQHLYAAYAMNTVLTDTFGTKQSILNNEFYTQINAAIDATEQSIVSGLNLDIASSPLGICMNDMENLMASHFGSGGLMPQTALK